MAEAPAQNEPRSLENLVGSLVMALEKGSPGDAASLRRLDAAAPSCAAFWKLSAAFLSADRRLSEEEERRWAIVMNVIAHAGGLHRFGWEHSLGRVLAKVGFSELRFTRLLRASDAALLKEAQLLGRLLATKAEPVDLTGVAWLVLSDGHSNEEKVRRNLARDYFGALRSKD
jgi:CRISPR type I-E-associated protein CasB/Cse2